MELTISGPTSGSRPWVGADKTNAAEMTELPLDPINADFSLAFATLDLHEPSRGGTAVPKSFPPVSSKSSPRFGLPALAPSPDEYSKQSQMVDAQPAEVAGIPDVSIPRKGDNSAVSAAFLAAPGDHVIKSFGADDESGSARDLKVLGERKGAGIVGTFAPGYVAVPASSGSPKDPEHTPNAKLEDQPVQRPAPKETAPEKTENPALRHVSSGSRQVAPNFGGNLRSESGSRSEPAFLPVSVRSVSNNSEASDATTFGLSEPPSSDGGHDDPGKTALLSRLKGGQSGRSETSFLPASAKPILEKFVSDEPALTNERPKADTAPSRILAKPEIIGPIPLDEGSQDGERPAPAKLNTAQTSAKASPINYVAPQDVRTFSARQTEQSLRQSSPKPAAEPLPRMQSPQPTNVSPDHETSPRFPDREARLMPESENKPNSSRTPDGDDPNSPAAVRASTSQMAATSGVPSSAPVVAAELSKTTDEAMREVPEPLAAAGTVTTEVVRHTAASDLPQPGLARSAANQIADALRFSKDRVVELRLSPEELGRVKVTMVAGEAGLSTHVLTERPETLELLRRHADMLAAELLDAGYSGLEFSFGREGQHESGPDGERPESSLLPEDERRLDTQVNSTRLHRHTTEGIDLRL